MIDVDDFWEKTTKIEDIVPDVSSGDGIVRTFEQCTKWAEKENCTLRVASEDELFIDIDTEEQYSIFCKMAGWYDSQHIIFYKWKVTPSKGGLPHRHIVVKLRQPASLLERVAMQATLGSDPMREAISIKRAKDGEENVVIFFEPKVAK